MENKEPSYLLFEYNIDGAPLFRNQTELVNELLNRKSSQFYRSEEKLVKAERIRLKTYVSQLLSDTTNRHLSDELITSLRKIAQEKKIKVSSEELDEYFETLIKSIRSKNKKDNFRSRNSLPFDSSASDFFPNIVDANYITIFTAREAKLKIELKNKKVSLAEFFLDDILNNILDNRPTKYYRFNFPRKETCILFWRGIKKELINYLESQKSITEWVGRNAVEKLGVRPTELFSKSTPIENPYLYVANKIAQNLSDNNLVSVYQTELPVFTVPVIAIDPHDIIKSKAYLLLLNETGEDNIHKMTTEEFYNWRFYVWENLRLNKSKNSLVPFSELY